MLDFADVFKIAPTLQQMQIPALSEAPQIRLLRLAEPNCKKQQAAGPSGFRTPVPGKAQPSAREQEQGPPTQGGLCPPHPNRAVLCPKAHLHCFLWEKQPLCHELEAEEGPVSSPVHFFNTQCWCKGRFGPHCLQGVSRGRK